MKLIIGLGNIGDKYVFTRHNVGFMVVDKLALDNSVEFRENTKLKCYLAKYRGKNNTDIMLIKPTTYMNLSGEALRAVIDYYKILPEDVIVIYDDLSLNLGMIRLRSKGSDGGHNGIKSLIQHLNTTTFDRLKIGIGPQPPIPAENFVLQNFDSSQLELLKETIKKSVNAIEYYLVHGINETQNKFN